MPDEPHAVTERVFARGLGETLSASLARVRGLSPLATLKRGYAVVQDADGHVVTSVAQTPADARLQVRVYDGRIGVVVRETSPEPVPDEEIDDE